jgi:hypothetical protein
LEAATSGCTTALAAARVDDRVDDDAGLPAFRTSSVGEFCRCRRRHSSTAPRPISLTRRRIARLKLNVQQKRLLNNCAAANFILFSEDNRCNLREVKIA